MNIGQDNGNKTSYISKSRYILAKKYFESVFFKIALAQCQSFRIIQNNCIENKSNARGIFDAKVDTENAGPTLIKDLQEITSKFPIEYKSKIDIKILND